MPKQPPKQLMKVTIFGKSHVVTARSAQNAVRKASKHLVVTGQITRQPPTDDEGGFLHTEVELL